MQGQLDHFKQLCEISDKEEEEEQIPTPLQEEENSCSAEETKEDLDWKSYVMISKNEAIRDKLLENKSFQDIAEKLIKFLEAN